MIDRSIGNARKARYFPISCLRLRLTLRYYCLRSLLLVLALSILYTNMLPLGDFVGLLARAPARGAHLGWGPRLLLLLLALYCICGCDCYSRTLQTSAPADPGLRYTNPHLGDFTALVLLVQFPEHAADDRVLPPSSYFRGLCANKIEPYLRDQSYGQYNVACDVQEWRLTNQSQVFFADGQSNMKGPERALEFAVPVLDQLDADPDFDWDKYDVNGDGLLDAVMIIHSGWSAETDEGLECNAEPWNDRIRSQGFSGSDGAWIGSNSNKRVFGYAIASALRYVCQDTPAEMEVITHEWLHTLGAIDLYDIGELVWQIPGGLGSFDIMANADGPRYDGNPGSMSPYSKLLVGWVEPVEIVEDGTYTIRTSNRHPDVFGIRQGYGDGEYLLIENRHIVGWDSVLPGNGGLLIYHVDTDLGYQDRPGWPDGPYYPMDHYLVALLQADGNYDLEKGNNNGDAGDYFTSNTPPLLPGGRGNFPNRTPISLGNWCKRESALPTFRRPAKP